MSYPLSHTVVNKKKRKEEKKKNNENNLSRSVTNGKQYKYQNTLSYSSHSYIVVVSFIGGGNRSTWRKQLNFVVHKRFIIKCSW